MRIPAAVFLAVTVTSCIYVQPQIQPVAAAPAPAPVAPAPVAPAPAAATSVAATSVAAAPAADSFEARVASIFKMQREGAITEAQAHHMLSACINGVNVATPAAGKPEGLATAAPIAAPVAAASSAAADLNLPNYKPESVLEGRMQVMGSDSMDSLMTHCCGSFKAYHNKLAISLEGKGSSTAVPAILEGRADIGPMSRELKPAEIARYRETMGCDPVALTVAIDTLAVYVHPDNPLKDGLTMEQLDAIFSESRQRGGQEVRTWGDLGLEGEWKDQPIRLISRNEASGTYAFFKEHVLKKAEFRSGVELLNGSREVVQAVANDRFAIGYSGIAYKTPAVKVLAIAAEKGRPAVLPEEIHAYSGDYPLTRSLFVVLSRKDGVYSAPAKEFSRFIFSREGQQLVRSEGYYPVNATMAKAQLSKMEK
ncbi:MAG: hypothetical protein RL095_3245 [Verrucomicrobiota bacterium]|jgi:phosphate transport system substrate-binding protein